MTWTRLSQGFKSSPTLFSEALSEDLTFQQRHPKGTLLLYVDDLLRASETEEECKKASQGLRKTVKGPGCWVSAKKAQRCAPHVTYLGYK